MISQISKIRGQKLCAICDLLLEISVLSVSSVVYIYRVFSRFARLLQFTANGARLTL